MAATIYDIAKEAGVSIATVSRVFNNSESVSKKTREKILAVAESKGYHPKAFAQGLARKNTKIIMALVPVISNYFFMEVLGGIQDKLAEYDYDLNIYNIKSNIDLFEQIEYVMKKGMADGYLFISIHLNELQWKGLKKYDVPITLMDEYHSDFDSVSVDSIEGAYSATTYLIKQDFEKIAMLSANPKSKPSQDRILGFKRALEDAGHMVNPDLIVTGNDNYRDGFSEKSGYQAMVKLLKGPNRPDAVFCASDIQAVGALKAMKDYDTHIPLISFDDLQMSEYLGLSTMRQPMYDMGALAISKLLDRISNPNRTVSHTVYSPELVIRNSTDVTANTRIELS